MLKNGAGGGGERLNERLSYKKHTLFSGKNGPWYSYTVENDH